MTAIRTALDNAARTAPISKLQGIVKAALKRPVRLSRDQQRGWSTKISFRAYNSLKNQGVLE